MFPIRDINPARSTPVVTYVLIAANVLVFFYQATLDERASQDLADTLGLKPAFVVGYLRGEKERSLRTDEVVGDVFGRRVLVREERAVAVDFFNAILPFLTSMFLHGGLMHLLGNLWFLHIFGDNVEDRLGKLRYLFFYLATGLAAGLAQVVVAPRSTIPCIGASGAISGILGAYFCLFPSARVVAAVPIIFIIRLFELPAVIFILIWFGMQLLSGLVTPAGQPGVAWWAHIGGFLIGVLLVLVRQARTVRPDERSSRYGQVRDVPFRIERD